MPEPSPWTREQQAAITDIEQQLAVVVKIITTQFEYLSRIAHDSQDRLHALGNVLTRKGLVAAHEWEAALQEVELGERAAFALNPEIQAGLAEVRKILRNAGLEPPDLGQ